MASLLASPAELATLTSLNDVVTFAAVEANLWTLFAKQLGNPPSVRILAMVPASVLQKTILGLRIPSGAAPADGTPPPTRDPNVTETIQMALVWRVARQAVGLEDMDPMLPGAESSSAVRATVGASPPVSGTPGVAAAVPTQNQPSPKKVKLSNVLDQTDDTEVATKTRAEMGIYFENHREITGADPLPEVEPTDLQVAAMEDKVVMRDESPYADFSILTPFGRRIQRAMKTKSYSFQPDGTWKAADIPGPPHFQAWQACFRVYRAVLFMLRYNATAAPAGGAPVSATRGMVTRRPLVVQPHSLERYFEAFKELCQEFPECWHLLMPAEDRMRAERFEHIRRNLQRAHNEGKVPLDVDFNPATPWDGVFQAAALDHQYWDANVRRPAVAFLARMGSQLQRRHWPMWRRPSARQLQWGRRHQPTRRRGRGRRRAQARGQTRRRSRRRSQRWKTASQTKRIPRSGEVSSTARQRGESCAIPGQRELHQRLARSPVRQTVRIDVKYVWVHTKIGSAKRSPQKGREKETGNRKQPPLCKALTQERPVLAWKGDGKDSPSAPSGSWSCLPGRQGFRGLSSWPVETWWR